MYECKSDRDLRICASKQVYIVRNKWIIKKKLVFADQKINQKKNNKIIQRHSLYSLHIRHSTELTINFRSYFYLCKKKKHTKLWLCNSWCCCDCVETEKSKVQIFYVFYSFWRCLMTNSHDELRFSIVFCFVHCELETNCLLLFR